MNTETTTFKTPSGEHEIVAKTFITGQDKREHRKSIIEMMENKELSKSDMQNRSEDAMLKAVIVSIDGKSENVVDTVLSMKAGDYESVVEYATDLFGGLSKKK